MHSIISGHDFIIFVQLYLYAQSNGRSSLILDEISSTSISYTQECSNINIHQAAFYVFHIFCLLLPFAFYFFTSLIIQSCRPRIRQILGPSTPRNNINQNYAALVLIGLIFSLYTLVLDGFALKAVAEDDTLHRYENEKVHKWTIASISLITIFDSFATLVSFVNIIILFILPYLDSEKYKCICISSFFCFCLWKILKCTEQNHNGNLDIEFETLVEGKRSIPAGEEDQKELKSETTTWLLMTSFMAPISCPWNTLRIYCYSLGV